MNEDLIIFIVSICIILLVWFYSYRHLKITPKGKIIFWINAGFAVVYEFYYLYNLIYNSEGGVGLVWMFLMIVVPVVHSALLFVFSLFYYHFHQKSNAAKK